MKRTGLATRGALELTRLDRLEAGGCLISLRDDASMLKLRIYTVADDRGRPVPAVETAEVWRLNRLAYLRRFLPDEGFLAARIAREAYSPNAEENEHREALAYADPLTGA